MCVCRQVLIGIAVEVGLEERFEGSKQSGLREWCPICMRPDGRLCGDLRMRR